MGIIVKTLKYILKFIILFIILTILYFLIAYIFTIFPKSVEKSIPKNKKIYILYNKMHSDIVLNIEDINKELKRKMVSFTKNKIGYISFGWGDKETYLNTPTWSDLSIKTSFKALFINTPSLIHISYIYNIDRYQKIKKIDISENQLKEIEMGILKSFDLKKNKKYKGYGDNDLFYPSMYSYNLFNTCNTWTGDRLRESNISVSYWTPLSFNIIKSLR